MPYKQIDNLLTIAESTSASYPPRTYYNATSSDLTVAFAVDFTTAGERLTAKAAKGKYLAIPLGMNIDEAAVQISESLKKISKCNLPFIDADGLIINIAGNSIDTLNASGWTQAKANKYLFRVLRRLNRLANLAQVKTGGQTGIDIAGAIAAYAINLPIHVTLPKGFKQRKDGVDFTQTEDDVVDQIVSGAAKLKDKT